MRSTGRELRSRDAAGPTRAVALLLHGGQVRSEAPTDRLQPPVLRMTALARALHRRVAGDGIAVWSLRFTVRGWNDEEASPVPDAFWALEQIRLLTGAPVVLVGHSMGGRTAVRAAGHASVRGVVALAPWLPTGEPAEQLTGRSLLVVHGSADRITSPTESHAYARRARAVADGVDVIDLPGEGHAMLRRAPTWNRLTAAGVRTALDRPAGRSSPSEVGPADAGRADAGRERGTGHERDTA